jgi:hypothetical protein
MKTKTSNKKPVQSKGSKRQQKKKLIVTSVAVGVAGILGYFGWKYLNNKRGTKKDSDIDAVLKNMSTTYHNDPVVNSSTKPKVSTTTAKVNYSSTSAKTSASDDFPLKKGSEGNN